MKKERTFLHIDGDAFFVACTVAMRPELAGLPVVTGYERGIAIAVSYEAKALGITRSMPISQIRREFPQVKVVESDFSAITIFSKRMINIIRRFAPIVEEYSIDECFADLTNAFISTRSGSSSKYFSGSLAEDIGRRIQKEIDDSLNISVSVGIGPTKVLAKLASNYQKPHGLTVITQANKDEYLKRIVVGKVWGIGKQTSLYLEQKGIKTAFDFTELKEKWIEQNMSKPFLELWHELKGNSLMSVYTKEEKEEQKSISKTGTFTPPSRNPIYVFAELSKNIENACAKMRKEGLRGSRAVMFVKRQDFKYYSIECVAPYPTNSPEVFISIAKLRFSEIFKKNEDYRATGFTVYDLSSKPLQNDLFGHTENTEKFETLHTVIDTLDQFFGKHTVHLGTSAKALFSDSRGTKKPIQTRSFFNRFAIPFGGSVV